VVLVEKAARRVGLYRHGALVPDHCWRIALAGGLPDPHLGTKTREGDRRTPEGVYRLSDKPQSSFRGAVAIHYPNQEDADRALAEGRVTAEVHRSILRALSAGQKPPQQTPLGGEILFHGGGAATDWTLGCIALDDQDLTALRAQLAPGWSALAWIRP
jgi:murein L,D-transpeptidase YafK